MPLPRLALTLIALLLLGEAAVAVWRLAPVPVSTAPVFSFPPAAANFGKSGSFARAVEAYGADRGAEWHTAAPDGSPITVFYFEWDPIPMRPMMKAAEHVPEQCNVAAGYKFLGFDASRTFSPPGRPPLTFDCTRFEDPVGRNVHMFRIGWIQGYGELELRQGFNRAKRLKDSFLRHQGAARVLQGGVFDSPDVDHAWQVFQGQVLDQLKW